MATETTTIQRWRTEDIDEQSVLLSGWEQEYRQLSCGRFIGNVAAARGPRITIAGERTNQSLHQSIVPPDGELVFGLVLNDDDALLINRRAVSTTSLIVLEGGREYDFRTNGSTDLLGISFEREWLLGRYGGQHGPLLDEALKRSVVQLESVSTAMLRQFWLMISQILQRGAEWPETMPLTLVADTALNNIVLALNMSSLQAPVQTGAGADTRKASVVRQAIQFMRAHLDRNLSIADVCAATHVSARTLQYHFEESLNMSPQQYLKVLRLNSARTLLRQRAAHASPSVRPPSIADIAAQCGYEHPSRFAGDYKRQFGTLPSETARSSTHEACVETWIKKR